MGKGVLNDEARLRSLVQQYGDYTAAARAAGVPRTSFQDACRRFGIESPKGKSRSSVVPGEALQVVKQELKDQDEALLKLLGKGTTVEELADRLDTSPRRVRERLEKLEHGGYVMKSTKTGIVLDREPMDSEVQIAYPSPSDHVRFAVVSDTHFGSKEQQITHLREFYKRAADRGVQHFYHVGDIVDGDGMYRGHTHEVFLHGFDEQVEYTIVSYPEIPGVETLVIGGNHDLSYMKKQGADPLKAISMKRPDIRYLGPYSAWVTFSNQARMYLLHPDGSPAYAKSYKLQNTIRSFDDSKKPDLLFLGHWHMSAYVLERNVHGWLAMCFQAQTSYMRRKALQPSIGGRIIDIWFEDDGSVHRLVPEDINFLAPRERDWD